MSYKLNKAQISEIKELYTKDSFGSVRELARIFNVSVEVIRWAVNYKNYREEQAKRSLKWQKANPARMKIINKRAYDRHKLTEKYKETRRKYYLKRRKNIDLRR